VLGPGAFTRFLYDGQICPPADQRSITPASMAAGLASGHIRPAITHQTRSHGLAVEGIAGDQHAGPSSVWAADLVAALRNGNQAHHQPRSAGTAATTASGDVLQ
jgi:hypothetical protein